MHKIPTLFEREGRFVIPKINSKAKWVLEEESIATRKYDGTCMSFENGEWRYRRMVKNASMPAHFIPVELDNNTGIMFGWLPVTNEFNFFNYFHEALDNRPLDCDYLDVRNSQYESGTYELLGPKINGNPEGLRSHRLMPHKNAEQLSNINELRLHEYNVEHAYDELAKTLAYVLVEGAVFYSMDGTRTAKIKRRDFPYGA